MVYTEYFASGSEPWDSCRLHEGRGMFQQMAGLFGKGREPQPVSIESTGLPEKSAPSAPVAAAEPATAVKPPSAPEPEKKKRGFWSRVFGKRDKDEKDEKDKKP
jgi:hypothetical protein